MRVGTTPYAIVVDEQRGRVLVFSEGPLKERPQNNGELPAGHGSVSMLDAATGRLLKTVPLGLLSYLWWFGVPAVAVLDERSGHVFLLNSGEPDYNTPLGPANVLMLDASTGTVRHVTALAPSVIPVALALDERT